MYVKLFAIVTLLIFVVLILATMAGLKSPVLVFVFAAVCGVAAGRIFVALRDSKQSKESVG